MSKPVKTCLILNMDGREDLWRLTESFRKEWSESGNIWIRIPGINYQHDTHVVNNFITQNKINLNGSGFRRNKKPFLGELGCFMGHYECWKYVVDNDLDSCLILEDGIEIVRNEYSTMNINSTLDILFVNEEMSMDTKKNLIGCGLQGYIVTKKGAKALLESCSILSAPIDLQIRHLCNNKTLHGSTMTRPFVKRYNNRVSSIDGIQVGAENPNDKQDPSPIVQRILMNLLQKGVNLDDYI